MSDLWASLRTDRRHLIGLFAAVPLLTLSGLFTSWGGAVRWKDCWQVAPWACTTHDDRYGLFPTGYDDYVGAPGAAAPLAIGSLLAFLAVVALVAATKPRWLVVLVLLLATPLLADADSNWRLSLDPQDTIEMWSVGPLTPVFMPVAYAFMFGGLFVAGVLVAGLGLGERRPWKPAERSAWICVAVVGWGHSLWGVFFAPQILADSHDDPAWMHTYTGVVVIGAALLLTWSLARATAGQPNEPHKPSEGEAHSASASKTADVPD
ncbi:MAG: hypothetical protein WBB15_09660 [Ornithinimicrobium sp.]